MKTFTLSKSSFGSGLQCHKRLWIEKKNPELVPEPSGSQQAVFDQGHEIGSWSQRLFPDGILLSGELEFASHLEASRQALTSRRPLFEPAFSIPGAYARADILKPVDSQGWDLLEVKSASNVWESGGEIKSVYLQDIAFQVYVYRAAGVDIRRSYLVFLNRDYVRCGEIDPHQLFRFEEVTQQIEAMLASIPSQLESLTAMLSSAESPDVPIGPQCDTPYECGLKCHCWKHVPDDSVFTLTRAGARAWTWWNNGIIRVVDLPVAERYSGNQTIQIAVERTGEHYFDVAEVDRFLQGLLFPLHYLDFETIMPAVPLFDGGRPYSQVPFQFSLHGQKTPGGTLSHTAFLADGTGDPRPAFLLALQNCLGQSGSIISYNSGFETARLRELMAASPYSAWIESILPRFANADLLKPFQTFAVYHPNQHGSASIKSVLPAFTDLSYDDLAIHEGGTASNQFLRLVKGQVPAHEVFELRENLLKYCERDTYAMVRLVDKLRSLVAPID